MRKTVESKRESLRESSNTQHADDKWNEVRGQPNLSQCHVRHWNECMQVRKIVTCEGVLFTPSISQDHATVFAWGFSQPGKFAVAHAEIRDSNIFLSCSNHCVIWFAFTLHFFINFCHMGAFFCFFPAILVSSTFSDKSNSWFRWTNTHYQSGTFSHPNSVFPTAIRPMDDHTGFVQSVPRDLQCLPMMLAIYVVEDVSIRPDKLIWKCFSTFWASSMFTWD